MIHIMPIPAFRDNYIWCLHDGHTAWVVDPGDAHPVLLTLTGHQLHLGGILLTHHHADHTGGVARLQQRFPEALVIGPAESPFQGITHARREGDRIDLLGTSFEVLAVPGHTLDHVAYVGQVEGQSVLFCGDTLFSAGCGRLFEGTPEQMCHSLARLNALPPETRIYCAHEYTLSNLQFARAVLGDRPAVMARIEECRRRRDANQPTLPVTLAEERRYNPFLMLDDCDVINCAKARSGLDSFSDNISIFTTIRRWKDDF